MKRPILVATIGYIIGIIMGLYYKINIVSFFVVLIFSILGITLLKNTKKIKRYLKLYLKPSLIVLTTVSIAIGYVYIGYLNYNYKNLYKDLEKGNMYIAKIISNVQEKQYTDCYTIEIIQIQKHSKYKGTKLLLYLTKSKNKLEYGDIIQFIGEFEYAQTKRNYGGFDYSQYLKKDGIYGLVKTNYQSVKIIEKQKNIFVQIRQSIFEKAYKLLPNESADLLLGILLGQKENIEEDTMEQFRQSSLAHILCVSGAHISYILLGITYGLDKSNLSKRTKEFIIIVILSIFTFLIGFSPSVIRAVFMTSILLVSKIFYRKNDIINSICLSLLFILLVNPFYIQDIGLLLSYGGTIGILLLYKNINKVLKKWIPDKKYIKSIRKILSVSISAQLFILPISVYYFNKINLLFFIGNILATPILGLIIILGFIILIISYIFFPIAKIMSILLQLLLQVLTWISKISSRITIF